jgi:hypothetical protein
MKKKFILKIGIGYYYLMTKDEITFLIIKILGLKIN